ncbi:coil containing protein [Vibrio phage 1.105.O._10N.286.49.B4]|nr:coil containing protein [Vibrio phage 1.105.O._10N.286.49.B4]
MYKLAKFRKQLKENVNEARHKRAQEVINDFKSCFYVSYIPNYLGIPVRAVKVDFNRYPVLKTIVKNHQAPFLGWSYVKEDAKHGQ